MARLKLKDGTKLYYKDWGQGKPVVFSHGWPLSADAFEDQMMYLAAKGYRCIAHDRRGHGRSDQPWSGYTMDQFADDLSELIAKLELREVTLVGHSMGGGEIARYVGRFGTSALSKIVMIGAVPPYLLKSDNNPDGVPMKVFDEMRHNLHKDRSQFMQDFSGTFYGAALIGGNATSGLRDAFWRQGMMSGLRGVYECVAAFSTTDFTQDLRAFDKPTLFIHGSDDQTVPLRGSSERAVKLVPNAQLKIYNGAPHGLCSTHKDQVNEDLLMFLETGRVSEAESHPVAA